MKSIVGLIVLAVLVASEELNDSNRGPKLNIIEVASRQGIYSYILALEETNNYELLANTNDITVFIPSNEAFKSVSESTREEWRKNPGYYQELMRYHVLRGRYHFQDFIDEVSYDTLAENRNLTGRYVSFKGFSKDVQVYMGAVINTSNVNIEASNGIIHYVDQVVGHIQNGSLLQTAQRIPSLSELLKGIAVANLTDVLSGITPYTFFAPSNDAIKRSTTWQRLLRHPQQLKEVLQYHIAKAGTWFSAGLIDGLSMDTLNRNGQLTVHFNNGEVKVDDATIKEVDIAGTNGVIHIIDEVLSLSPDV